jgi:hypothetical protein
MRWAMSVRKSVLQLLSRADEALLPWPLVVAALRSNFAELPFRRPDNALLRREIGSVASCRALPQIALFQ